MPDIVIVWFVRLSYKLLKLELKKNRKKLNLIYNKPIV